MWVLKRNLGWAIEGDTVRTGIDVDELIGALELVLADGPLALGFEAPLFVPLHFGSQNLTRGRQGEGDRPFSAAVGSTALVTGIVVISYILRALRSRVTSVTPTFDWRVSLNKGQMLLFEAFVSHQLRSANENPHIQDARLAIAKFREGMDDPSKFVSAVTESPCFSILGSILLRTKWTSDLSFLEKECLVVRQKGAPNKAN